MWSLPHARGTALGCYAVAACGVSSILVSVMDGNPDIQLPLEFIWMSISFWPAIESEPLRKQAPQSVTCDAAARAELLKHRFGAIIGTFLVPWLIASGAFFAEVLTKAPVVVMPQPIPLSVRAVPFALGLSTYFSLKLLLSLLTHRQEWGGKMPEPCPRRSGL